VKPASGSHARRSGLDRRATGASNLAAGGGEPVLTATAENTLVGLHESTEIADLTELHQRRCVSSEARPLRDSRCPTGTALH
jgi:hypothetical protein